MIEILTRNGFEAETKREKKTDIKSSGFQYKWQGDRKGEKKKKWAKKLNMVNSTHNHVLWSKWWKAKIADARVLYTIQYLTMCLLCNVETVKIWKYSVKIAHRWTVRLFCAVKLHRKKKQLYLQEQQFHMAICACGREREKLEFFLSSTFFHLLVMMNTPKTCSKMQLYGGKWLTTTKKKCKWKKKLEIRNQCTEQTLTYEIDHVLNSTMKIQCHQSGDRLAKSSHNK